MIQRKQTIFLAVALILILVCMGQPIATLSSTALTTAEDGVVYNLCVVWTNGKAAVDYSVSPLFVFLLVSCPLMLIAIFTYRNRRLQARLCLIAMLLLVAWYVVGTVDYCLFSDDKMTVSPRLSLVFPLISLILVAMARRAILADEALVRAADRIR